MTETKGVLDETWLSPLEIKDRGFVIGIEGEGSHTLLIGAESLAVKWARDEAMKMLVPRARLCAMSPRMARHILAREWVDGSGLPKCSECAELNDPVFFGERGAHAPACETGKLCDEIRKITEAT